MKIQMCRKARACLMIRTEKADIIRRNTKADRKTVTDITDKGEFGRMTKFEEFENIIARLRAPDGCPWDREQTHMSLKKPCIEEAAEVICGINILDQTGDPDNLKEEDRKSVVKGIRV